HRVVADAERAQRQGDDGGVVDVGVVVVLVLERPPAGSEIGNADGPVALHRHLLAQEVVAGEHELRMVGGNPARAQRQHGERGVPHRRLACLGTQAVAVLDHESFPAFDRLAQRFVLEAVPERVQRDDPPDPRWLDAAPRSVRLLPRTDPLLRASLRQPAQRVAAQRRARASWNGADVEQVDVDRLHGTQRLCKRERDERLARPAGEVVDREPPGRRQEDELGRDRKDPLPGPLAEEREEALREDAGLANAAFGLYVLLRLRPGVDTAHAQRDVRLDRRRQIGRALEPDRPRSVVAHARHELVPDAPVHVRRTQAEEVVPEQMLRRHGHVRLQLADPHAVGPLQLEQAPRPAVDGRIECRECRRAHRARRYRAAARPLRTALSIVAGQPVSVHVPARATFGRAVCTPGLTVPGRSAIVAFGSRLTRDQTSSASPSRSVSWPAMRSTSSRPRTSMSSGTPLETTVRYWPPASGWWPVSAPRSKTQWASDESRAAIGVLR